MSQHSNSQFLVVLWPQNRRLTCGNCPTIDSFRLLQLQRKGLCDWYSVQASTGSQEKPPEMPRQKWHICHTWRRGGFRETVTHFTGQCPMLTHSTVHSVTVRLQTLCVQIWSVQDDLANRDEMPDGRTERYWHWYIDCIEKNDSACTI